MWIVRFALQRPYTFVIVALLIAIFGVASIMTTPTCSSFLGVVYAWMVGHTY
jgi:multidrug efflux pump subunit AcrB